MLPSTLLTLPIASSLALFALVSSITPGPNNTMLLASGANFGFRASLPHAAGVFVGFLGLIALCGLGLGGIFKAFPILRWLSVPRPNDDRVSIATNVFHQGIPFIVSTSRSLDEIQRWLQTVITHPPGVAEGVASREARKVE